MQTQNKDSDRLTLNIRKSDADDYKRLRDKDSPLENLRNKDLFILAMCMGYQLGNKVEHFDNKESYVRVEYFTDKDMTLLKSLAVSDKGSLDILLDKNEIYSIAEGYAAGGIKSLKDLVFSGESYASFSKRLESDICDKINEIKENY